jgi:hypothetical protein
LHPPPAKPSSCYPHGQTIEKSAAPNNAVFLLKNSAILVHHSAKPEIEGALLYGLVQKIKENTRGSREKRRSLAGMPIL